MVLKLILNMVLGVSIASFVACSDSHAPESSSTTNETLDAQKLYSVKCAICHGPDGKLMVGGAPDISSTPLTKHEIISLITNGKGTMPAQKHILSDAEIESIANYVLTSIKQ